MDLGTSGVRICVINCNDKSIVFEDASSWPSSLECCSHETWVSSLSKLVHKVPTEIKGCIGRLCISGTSGSALVYKMSTKSVSRRVRMYDFNVLSLSQDIGKTAMNFILQHAPANSSVVASTSTLAKLISWHFEEPLSQDEVLMHQADFVAAIVSRRCENNQLVRISDWHNSLKLGYDVHSLEYPPWLLSLIKQQGITTEILPQVVEPGKLRGVIHSEWAADHGLSADCKIIAGDLNYVSMNLTHHDFTFPFSQELQIVSQHS